MLLSRITQRQLMGWMEYYRCEPWGEQRADLRMGILASTVAALYCHKGQTPQPRDFMPRFGERAKPQSTQQMRAIFAQAARHWGKK